MTVILAIVGAGVIAGLLAWGVTLRWPDHDPVAPRLEADSPVLQHETGHRPRRRALWRAGLDAEVATGLAVTGGAVALLVLVALAGVLLLMVRTHSGVARYDLAFARWGAAHASSGSTHVLRLLSNLGGTAGVVTVAVVVAAVEYRRLPNRAVPALLAVTVLGQFALVNLIKVIVERARPNLDQLTGFSSSSFPSGHAAAAAATFAAVALLVGRRRARTTRAVIAGTAVAIAVTVAGTRVMLGVHWLTDVLAGLAIGWAWFTIWSLAFGGRLLDFGAPAALAGAGQAAGGEASP